MKLRDIAAGLMLLQTLCLARIAYVTSPVLDELPHLAAGISHWEFGNFDLYRVNPPLVRMIAAIPVMAAGIETDWMGGWSDDPFGRPEFPLGRRLGDVNGERTIWLYTLARWSLIPFAWLGGWICFRWGRALYGDFAGLTALSLWCVCPLALGWGATICPDMPAAAMGIWAAYAFWHWLGEPSWPTLALAALATGLALLTKSTWIILFGLWPLLWGVWRWSGRHESNAAGQSNSVSTAPPPGLGGLATILCGALYIVHVGYGFAGALRPLGEFRFISRTLSGHEELGEPGNRFRDSWLAALPAPLPADYLLGIDVQRYEFEHGKWSYLRGEQKLGGWWWYYLYALGVKLPVGTLALVLLGTLNRNRGGGGARWRDELVLLAPALAVLALVSSQTGFNRHLRYVLPALPGLYIWAGRFLAAAAEQRLPRFRRALTSLCLLAAAVSSLRVWPHSLAYFNELAGGPEQGHRHLLDSNIDWGQGLLPLRDWVREHPEAQPLFVSDFGWVAPRHAGIEAKPVPRLWIDSDGRLVEGDPSTVVPGWYAVSVNHVLGYQHYEHDRPVYTWLAEFEPIARPGYANWVYRLAADDVAKLRERHPTKPPR